MTAWLTPTVLAAHPNWTAQTSPSGTEETAEQILARFPAAVALHPQTIVILAGTWDMATEPNLSCSPDIDGYEPPTDPICQAIVSMATEAQNAGILVVVGTLAPWGIGPLADQIGDSTERQQNIIAFNQYFSRHYQYNQTAGIGVGPVEIADFYYGLAGEAGGPTYDPQYTDDGVTPNPSGGALMTAEAIYAINLAIQAKENPIVVKSGSGR